jgi:lipopolysaccharide transport system ATP-binding protein
MTLAIQARGLSKRYVLGEDAAVYGTIRESLARLIAGRPDESQREIWAVRGLDLDVEQGELLGVVGRNGAGKTTLLKLVSRITEPTSGFVRVRGRVGTLLEVGTGFHPELTGRENVFLNGAILGMQRGEIEARFGEIVEFAGIGSEFLDTPLKRYSMGMRLRLAFAIAAHLESDLVLVDEVLAVGDAEFRRRSTGAMSDLAGRGRTVLFTSHDLGAISELCDRVLWLDRGRVLALGSPDEVLTQYGEALADQPLSYLDLVPSGGPVEITEAAILDPQERRAGAPSRDRPLTISLGLDVRELVPGMHPAIIIRDAQGIAIINEIWERRRTDAPFTSTGPFELRLTLPPILTAGEYVVELWVGTRLEDLLHRQVMSFVLAPGPGDHDDHALRPRLIELGEASWEVQPVHRPSSSSA